MIPKQLNNPNIRFCKIQKRTKKPYEKDWTNQTYTYEQIQEHLKNNDENYGVVCGYGNLAVIDADNEAFQVAVENMFPRTFKVKTGSGGTHNYFFVPDLKQKIILYLDDKERTHLGEVQSFGSQVVGANSIHPNGNSYVVTEDLPIETITCELLLSNLKPFMKKEIAEVEANAYWENARVSEVDNLDVASIWGTAGMKKQGQEYYGSHPTHGSDGGMNFWINPLKNTWHCFRCNSGGGVLSAIAVKHGIIDCSEARKGNLRGDNARKCIEIAKSSYGLENDFKQFLDTGFSNFELGKEDVKIIWDKDLKGMEIPQKDWIVDKLIPTKSVCILTGKRGTMKTFISLNLGYCVALGDNFLETYQTEQGKVIYLDKENGLDEMKKRTSYIKQGMNFKDNEEIGFICFSQLKLDRFGDIMVLEKFIEEHKPKLLIIDTYRRAISYDENDAGEVSKLFVDTLRPLVEKHNFSVLLIHHNRKGSHNHQGGKDEDSGIDEMDELRGSSDLANYADGILKLERGNSNYLVLKQLKNRSGQEEKPIKIKVNFDENGFSIKNEGEFVKNTLPEKFMQYLLEWIAQQKVKHFTTKQVKDLAFRWGIKQRNFERGIEELLGRGIIERTSKGEYDVKI